MKTISIQRSPIGARQSSPAMNAAKTAADGYQSNRQNNTIIIDKEWYTLMLKSKFITALSTACAVLSMTAPVAFAADGDSVQDNYQEYDSNTSKWGDATTKSTVANDKQHDGSIHIQYDTNGGWEDPGKDPSVSTDNGKHEAGTFVVTIPTLIKHTGLVAGKVDITDKYTVNVRGSIPGDMKVHLEAETNKDITNLAGTDSFTETTKQEKTDWSSGDTYGSLATDGALLGMDSTDTITLAGEAKTSGTYTGTVAYTATLVNDPSVEARTSGTNTGGTDNGNGANTANQLKNNRKQIRPTAGFVVQKGQSQWMKLILAK